MFPVVEASAAKVIIVDAKTQGTHEPKLGSHGHTGTPHAAGVVGDFGLVQHNMQLGRVFHTSAIPRRRNGVKSATPDGPSRQNLASSCKRQWQPPDCSVVKTSLSSANASLTNGRLARYTQALKFAERQVAALVESQPDFLPIYTVKGRWQHEGPLWTDWCGGFLAGMMWQFHLRTGSPEWRNRAEHYSKLLEHRQFDRNVHDLGFIFLSTYLPWYELTHERRCNRVLVQAGRTLAMRFMEKGQYLRSFVAPSRCSSTS